MQHAPILLPPDFAGSSIACGEGLVMLVPGQPAARDPLKNWNQKCAKGVGIAIITVAVVAFTVNIGWLTLSDSLATVGVGFWAGIPMAIVGILLTIAGFRPKRGLIISVLVMSIIANLVAIGFLSVGAAQMNYRSRTTSSYSGSYHNYSYIVTSSGGSNLSASFGMGTFYVLVGLTSIGLLLTASVLSCYSVCADCGKKVAPHPTLFCLPQGLGRNPDGSMMQPMYCNLQGMQQLPTVSYGYAPQGMPPSPPPTCPVYPATAPNLDSQSLS